MISHQYRCIFIHQRKTAGCSIITSFGLTDAQPEWRLFNDGTLSDEWRRRAEIAPGYRVFTVIRNPWDRFVSGWKYLSATRKKSLKKVLKNLPPPETGHDYKHLTRPQLDILMDEQGKFVPDYVLRFEHLAGDYAKFCDLIGKPDKTLPKLNSTGHDPYQSCFDANSMERFAHHFKKDVEFLGYHFSGPANHINLRGKILV
jgi:Sulfotransferase family